MEISSLPSIRLEQPKSQDARSFLCVLTVRACKISKCFQMLSGVPCVLEPFREFYCTCVLRERKRFASMKVSIDLKISHPRFCMHNILTCLLNFSATTSATVLLDKKQPYLLLKLTAFCRLK